MAPQKPALIEIVHKYEFTLWVMAVRGFTTLPKSNLPKTIKYDCFISNKAR